MVHSNVLLLQYFSRCNRPQLPQYFILIAVNDPHLNYHFNKVTRYGPER